MTTSRDRAEVSAPEPSAETSIWRNRSFLGLWVGDVLSTTGTGFNFVALSLWVLQTTGSAKTMAVVMALRYILAILLGVIAGTVSDRTDRRRLMFVMDLARFAAVAGIWYMISHPGSSLVAVIGLSCVVSICSQFHHPALQASLIHIVGREQLPKASSLLQTTQVLGMAVGPILAGIAISLSTVATGMAVDAVSYLIASVLMLLVCRFPSPIRDQVEQTSFWADLVGGFSYIKDRPLIRSLAFCLPVMNFFSDAAAILLPVIAVKIWQVSSVQFGLMEGLLYGGSAVGAGLVMALGHKLRRRGRWISGGMIASGLLAIAVLAMPAFHLAVGPIFLVGIFLALTNVLSYIALQSEVLPEMQGRVFGTFRSLETLGNPASILLAGVLADLYGPATIGLLASGLFAVVTILAVAIFPAIRQYR